MDYKYLRWQVIDTPGILDRPLEERNTIEMQSITALAHIRAAVVYMVDVSEQCGYTLAQQAALFHSIKPLFANKPILIVANKTDVRKYEDLDEAGRAEVEHMVAEARRMSAGGSSLGDDAAGAEQVLVTCSTLTETGLAEVKTIACDRLLNFRVEMKVQVGRQAGRPAGQEGGVGRQQQQEEEEEEATDRIQRARMRISCCRSSSSAGCCCQYCGSPAACVHVGTPSLFSLSLLALEIPHHCVCTHDGRVALPPPTYELVLSMS